MPKLVGAAPSNIEDAVDKGYVDESLNGKQPLGRMTLADLRHARGVNWYGMEDQLRGPTLAELKTFRQRGYNAIRLPLKYSTTNAAVEAVLTSADEAGIWVLVEVHNYGRIGGTAAIDAVDGTVIDGTNQEDWFDKCVDQLEAFKSHPSYVPCDMNEPSQTGAEWEPISQGRVDALRTAGWTGLIGVVAGSRSSAGSINNASIGHPGGWWIDDPLCFLEVHHYLGGLDDDSLQSRATLDAYAAGSGQGVTTYLDYVHKTFGFGCFGTALWDDVPILIGEFAMPPGMELELHAFLQRVDSRRVGAIEWASWEVNPGSNYAWKMTEEQYAVLSGHCGPVPTASINDTTNLSTSATWSANKTNTALSGKQNLDSDLTAIAGLSSVNDDFIQRKSGAWENRTVAQVKTDLGFDDVLVPFGFIFDGDPTGVADSTSEMQDAIDDHEVILLPPGTYKIGQITHTGASRTIRALGPVTIIQTDPDGVFDFKGAWDLLGTISSFTTSAVALGDDGEFASNTNVSVLTMSSSVTVTKGDVLKIISDDINPYGRPTIVPKMGEFSLAGISSTGTMVTLTNVLVEPYATNIRLVRPQDVTFRIEGDITFDTDPAIRETTVFGAVLGMRSAKWCYVGGGVKFFNSLGRAINNTSYRSIFDGIIFRNLSNRPTKSHYGYGVQDGGWQMIMRDCHGENLRHMYSEGNGTVDHTSTEYDRYGGGWYAQVANCTGMNCQAQVFDTHGTAYGIVFSDCHAVGSFIGASSGGSGFSARGRNITFRDCTTDACMVGYAISGTNSRLENCVARRTYYQALQIAGDTSDATGITTITGIAVEGGVYENLTNYECVSIGADGFNITARISRVRARMLGTNSGARGFYLTGSGTLRVDMKDVVVDFEGFTGTAGVNGVYIAKDSVTLRCNGLIFRGGSAPYTGASVIVSGGASAGNGSDVEALEIEYEHTSVSPTLISTGITKRRIAARSKFGASWFHDLTTSHITITAAASVALTTIATFSHPVLIVRFTGSAGDLTTGNLPAFSDGLRQGQIIHFINNSNGIITLPSSGTNPSATTAIPVNGFVSFEYGGDSWRRISAPSLDVQPLDSDLTTIAGLTPTTDNFLQAKSSAWASRTVAQVKTDLGLTGTNSGDQTSIVGITGTKVQFDTAVTDGNFLYAGDVTQYSDELAQDAIGTIVVDTDTIDIIYTDATPELKADVRVQMSIISDSSGLKFSGDSATPGNSKLYGTDGTGVKGWFDQPVGGSGVSDGDKGDITVSGTGTIWTIDNDAVTYAKIQNVSAQSRVLGRISAGAGDVEELTGTDIRNMTGLATINTPYFTGIEVGHSSDTTLTRSSSGVLAVEGVIIPTVSSTSTLTNKTLTSPKVNEVLDTANGLKVFTLTGSASAVNYLDIKNNTTTLTPAITALGTDTDVSINLVPKGAGRVRANGTIIPTTTSADTLTNKVLTSPVIATIVNTGTLTLPTSTDTLVGRDTTDTLTNKTLTSPVINTPTGIVKGDVGLGNVDNTSDATKNSASVTLTNKTITAPVIATIVNTGTLTLPTSTDTLVGRATTDTLTSKRVTPRVGTTASSATPTINTDTVDFYSITAQTEAITSFTTNLSGTPTDGQKLWIAITGTAARAITWGVSFEASTVALPTTTVTTARLDVGFVWNAVTSKWRCVATC